MSDGMGDATRGVGRISLKSIMTCFFFEEDNNSACFETLGDGGGDIEM